jgi:hypothetical protein
MPLANSLMPRSIDYSSAGVVSSLLTRQQLRIARTPRIYCTFLISVFFFLDSFFFPIAVSFPGSPCARKRILLFLPEGVEMRYLHGSDKFTLILQNPQPAYQEISILF